MLLYKVYAGKTVTLSVGIAPATNARDCRPKMGLVEDIERLWKKLHSKFGKSLESLRQKRPPGIKRTVSALSVERIEQAKMEEEENRKRRASISFTFKHPELYQASLENMHDPSSELYIDDVFSPYWRPPKWDKNDPRYGRPAPGSLTEKRGIAAGNHIGKEIIRLCEVIEENGASQPDGTITITFGKLFQEYVYISDKVVGMLLRARKHGLVSFAGEMLYQRRDEAVVVTMLKSLAEVQLMYANSDDPKSVLRTVY